MAAKTDAEVIIGGKVLTLCGYESEEYLQKVASYINNKLAIVLPHPSPLNIKWFKDHPEFMEKRIFEIRNVINKVLEK